MLFRHLVTLLPFEASRIQAQLFFERVTHIRSVKSRARQASKTPCDQIWRNFTTLMSILKYWAIF